TGKEPIGGPTASNMAWIGNPAYAALAIGEDVRWLEWLGMPYRRDEYRKVVQEYADFTLRLFGGDPYEPKRYGERYLREWPSRTTMLIPLMLCAYRQTGEARYAQAARMVYDDVFAMIDRNPQGFWESWTFNPQGDRVFDTVYNYAGLWR